MRPRSSAVPVGMCVAVLSAFVVLLSSDAPSMAGRPATQISSAIQSQVRPEIGYTFANGLRTTLRQDPDVIMVGEIRDKETAQLAVQAAFGGDYMERVILRIGIDGPEVPFLLFRAFQVWRGFIPGKGYPLSVW